MFMILGDDNPLKSLKFQYVTMLIVVACVIVFFVETTASEETLQGMLMGLAFTPSHLLSGDVVVKTAWSIPPVLTLISSMFLHGDLGHLLGNMFYLWIFGDNVEDAMGHWRFVGFYLVVGVVAGLVQAMGQANSQIPMIGASGAISGILGAYMILYPNAKIRVFFNFMFLHLSAAFILITWVLLQLLQSGSDDGIAWFAHIGGFVAGALLIPFFKKSHIPLFGDKQNT